ncbi:MAG: fibrobacter succinogenes major paralogous domain-containing protein, partial [Bacteroidota bacterium]
LMPYLRKLDTASVSDRINLKVNIADTAGMLIPYLRKQDTISVSERINLKVNIADTAGMLNPYLRKLDTASVSNRINLKVSIADTAGMLNPYLRKLDTATVSNRINLKVNIADTAGMLTPYLRKLDTASVSDRINLKVNIADTSNMLANYRSALNVKAPINNPTFTGTVSGVDKNMVGLGSVDNTSDANKPVSTATQTALNGKENTISSGTTGQYYRGDKTFQTLDKSVVGLGNVDNTSDANKPVSTATQTALNLKVNIADTANMLTPYLRKLDTSSLSNRINNAGLPTTGNSTGNLLYWNGSAWVRLSTGSNGQILKISAGGIPVWGNADFDCGLNRLKDIDGNIYNTVAIGSQCWTKENLKVTKYNDGTSIPLLTSGEWTIGASFIYDNQASNGTNATNYGFLYNWHAVKDTRGLCPTGWHIPTDAEWTTLTDYLGGLSVAGGKMKSTGTTYWNSTNTGATNESGFSALPGGSRDRGGGFSGINSYAFFWSANEDDSSLARDRSLSYNNGSVYPYHNYKAAGASIRCLKD